MKTTAITIIVAGSLLGATAALALAAENPGDQVGQGCKAKDVFDMHSEGSSPSFSVRCEDGREFLVIIYKGGTAVVPCNQATAVCFKTYDEQEHG